MALDGLVVHALVHELQQCVGGRINKIYQPNAHDILLLIRTPGRNLKLLLSASPTYPRVHLTGKQYSNPLDAPMFCMLLRKHCEGGVIDGIEQVELERIIRIRIKQRDELGDIGIKTITAELMGRHSNIILLDEQKGIVLDSIRHVTPAISRYRVVMPGSAYVPPPDQGKINPFTVDRKQFLTLMSGTDGQSPTEEQRERNGEASPENRLLRLFSGISPLISKEIARRAERMAAGRPQEADEALWESFLAVTADVRNRRIVPNIVTLPDGEKTYFSVVELTHLNGDKETFASISECLERYYGEKAERDAVKQQAGDLFRLLKSELTKNKNKIEKLQAAAEEAKNAENYRKMGELLTASMHLIRKGDERVDVIDYYDEAQPTITIELDPQLTPSENCQRYFKRYNKAKNSMAAIAEQLRAAEDEIRYLETVLQQLEGASLADLEEIREELAEQGYVRLRGKAKTKKKTDKPVLTGYISSEGIPIWVGKNNKQNEYLTNRLARPSDTWLHTKDIPGSHVVIRASEYGETTLHEAAQLAAYYSQARESSRVPVDYTLIRHVRKPNGAKPGFVIYDHQKTLYVTPDPDVIANMQKASES